MIAELKSAVGNIIPRANYVDAGTLGLSNIDQDTRLDPVIADRLSTINRTSAALSRAQAVSFDAHQEALAAFKDAESTRDRYAKEYEEAHHAKPDPDVLANLEREVRTAKAATDTGDVVVRSATQRSAGTRAALAAAVKLLNDRNRAGRTVKVAKPVKLTGAPAAVVVEQREAARSLDDELYDVEHALIPVQDAVDAIRMKVGLLAAAGRPRISVSSRGADIDLAGSDYLLLAQGQNGQVPIAQPDAAAFAAWLLEGVLADKAEAAVRERFQGDATSLSTAERVARLASIAQRRLDAERVEVAAVLAAWAQGDFSLGLRADTNPVAVLNLAA